MDFKKNPTDNVGDDLMHALVAADLFHFTAGFK